METTILKTFLAFVLVATVACPPSEASTGTPKDLVTVDGGNVSAFGRYEGYSEAYYDGYVRRSQYIPMRDGVRLAADYFLPTRDGKAAQEKLPVIFFMTPYHRASIIEGELHHLLSSSNADSRIYGGLVRHGYVVAAVDVRGQGASFGGYHFGISAEEARDGFDLVEWFASQPWSSGKIGMMGGSYMAQTQYLTASEHPPHLTAIFPAFGFLDSFEVLSRGGLRELYFQRYFRGLDELAGRRHSDDSDSGPEPRGESAGEGADAATGAGPLAAVIPRPAPVEGAEHLLEQAIAEHKRLDRSAAISRRLLELTAFRGEHPMTALRPVATGPQNLAGRLEEILSAEVPAYHWSGWNDYVARDALRYYANWRAPQKLTIGPWSHNRDEPGDPRGAEDRRLQLVEALRWFDYWLKGIDNGVLDEAPIHYAIQTGGHYSARDADAAYGLGQWHWQSAEGWPPAPVQRTQFHLAAGATGTVDSQNDGALRRERPDDPGAHSLSVDDEVSTGTANRLVDATSFARVPLRYPDMRDNDARSLTYTSAPLAQALTVVGTPRIVLHARSTADDGAIVAWLEGVDPTGYSTLISYGAIRASHRTLGVAPYDNLGNPWVPSSKAIVEATPPFDEAVARLELPLTPTGTRFRAGNRVRLTIAGADAGNLESAAPAATITVFHGGRYRSILDLPRFASDSGNPEHEE